MPIRNPAHKQVIREQFDRPIHELGDYVKRVEDSEKRLEKKKLTFEEWCDSRGYGPIFLDDHWCLEECWKAAQENTPSQAPGAEREKEWYEPREDV